MPPYWLWNKQSQAKDHSDSPSYSLEKKRLNKGKEIAHNSTTIDIVKVIVGGFVRGGLNNNACKKHLWVVMTVENKKVKPNSVEEGLII